MTQQKNLQPHRIIIVSNRLPVSIYNRGQSLEFIETSGGLSTGLRSLPEQYTASWIGWPGTVPSESRNKIETELIDNHHCYPVFIQERLIRRYYSGFSNRTIWPLFHSFPAYAKYNEQDWIAYREVNRLFCNAVMQLADSNDYIWVHDYHLMLLPHYLRQRMPEAKIGFFLHIPFPHFDILRLLPQHKEIVEHLISADLIGFHTYEYAHSFMGCVRRLLGIDNSMGQMIIGDRAHQIDVFPMGIDFTKYSNAAKSHDVNKEVLNIKSEFGEGKLIFTVSRLDYTKGLPETLRAVAELFRQHPEYNGKINFILVVVPSREEVDRYASLKREIDELVGNINSKYGNLKWNPIRYIYRSLTFDELMALYVAADVAYIAPLRDGMNLIAKEYLAAKNDNKGVLIMSETAGTAKELLEALIINPNSKEEGAAALHQALQMPDNEQIRCNDVMRQRLISQDISKWVERFFLRLDETAELSSRLSIRLLDNETLEHRLRDFRQARQRLIVLDYDGTLVPFAEKPSDAVPDEKLFVLLDNLSSHVTTDLILLSGRDHETMDLWFRHLDRLTLVSEHGGWILKERNKGWITALGTTEDNWKKQIKPLLEIFVNRIPGSFIEDKTFSLVWHYRRAEPESANTAAKELLDTLTSFASNLQIQVLLGSKTVEVRSAGIGKGIFLSRFLTGNNYDFIMAIGDDWTDEDMFAVLPDSAFSIKVGISVSKARFNVKSYTDVRSILKRLGGRMNA